MHLKILLYFFCMAKKSKTEDIPITANAVAMRTFAAAIRKIAAKHDEIADWMDKEQIATISPKNFKTAAQFLVHVSKFTGNCVSECCEALSEKGVQDLQGGLAVLRLYLERTSSGLLAAPIKDGSDDDEQDDEKTPETGKDLEGTAKTLERSGRLKRRKGSKSPAE